MEIKSIHVTSSKKQIEALDLVSEKIIIYGIKKADGLIYDGTFVLKELVTMYDTNDNEITTEQWENMVGQTITFKGVEFKILGVRDPVLEKKLDGILRNGILSANQMDKRGMN